MKLQDFGLWFQFWPKDDRRWSATIPEHGDFRIYYDGRPLGRQFCDFSLTLKSYDYYDRYIITVKGDFPEGLFSTYQIGRILTLDDFKIVENSDYQEIK